MNTPSNHHLLSVAGFDPTGGAGVLADIKTFESIGVSGMGVCTSVTYQHDHKFDGVEWVPLEQILKQIKVLQEAYSFPVVKIGLVNNLQVLSELIDHFKNTSKEIEIVWDPIMKASAGFSFHKEWDISQLKKILAKVSVITPNKNEAEHLLDALGLSIDNLNYFIIRHRAGAFLIKSMLQEGLKVNDILYTGNKKEIIEGTEFEKIDKHGTGCVYSSALAAFLFKEKPLIEACREAKNYVEHFLNSTVLRLGLHKTICNDMNKDQNN